MHHTTETNGQQRNTASKADCERVRYLAATLDDWARGVKTSTGQIVQRSALPGELATRKRVCPSCDQGWRRERGIPRPCMRCGATGKILVDAYTRREVAPPAGPDVPIDEELRQHYEELNSDDGTKGLIRSMHRERIDAIIDEHEGGVGSLRDRHYARGSYPELVVVLDRMRAGESRRYRDFMRFLVGGLPVQSSRMEQRVGRLVVLVAYRMPKPIRVPAEAKVKEQDGRRRLKDMTAAGERNTEIRRLVLEEGWKQSRAAREFGLSQGQVSKIVASQGAAA